MNQGATTSWGDNVTVSTDDTVKEKAGNLITKAQVEGSIKKCFHIFSPEQGINCIHEPLSVDIFQDGKGRIGTILRDAEDGAGKDVVAITKTPATAKIDGVIKKRAVHLSDVCKRRI